MPRTKDELSADQRRTVQRVEARIVRLEAQLDQARQELAVLAENYGTSAVARELGISRQNMHAKIRASDS
jgi:hypothetical protein